MYIYYKIYKSMRRGRIHGEKNMRNSRTKTQTKLRNYIKLTAGALLLAITFVLVFAGTLSGAFGIENELQQNGTIENNVASAANVFSAPSGATTGTIGFKGNQQNVNNYLEKVLEEASDIDNNWGWNSANRTGNGKTYKHENTYGVYQYSDRGTIEAIVYVAVKLNLPSSKFYTVTSSAMVSLWTEGSGSADVAAQAATAINGSSKTPSFTYPSAQESSSLTTLVKSESSSHGAHISVTGKNSQAFGSGWENSNAKITSANSVVVKGNATVYLFAMLRSTDNRRIATTSRACFLDSISFTAEEMPPFDKGSGTLSDPFLLEKRADFDKLSSYVLDGEPFSDVYFKIQPDTSITGQSNGKTIEMGSSAFTPIGYYGTSSTFKGSIDGNGCTIKGLKVDLSIARAGFIGALSGGSVKNLTIDSTSTIKSSTSDAAGIVGYMTGGIVENCLNYATVSGGKQNGGVVANVNNDNAIIRNCKNYGAVSGTVLIGGIVGYLQKGTIQTCSNSGKATATGNAITLNSLTGAYLGGIAGYANGNISNCYNEGEVTTGTSWGSSNIVGGIAGYVVSGKTVAYCYNKGAVSGSNDIGGIVGNLAGGISAVSYCYHDGKINGLWNDASANIGYIAGNQSGVFGTSWKLPGASISSGAYTPKENARVISFGTGVSYSPAVISGGIYSDKVWTDITNSNINGFKTTATVTDGQYLSSATASNGATSVSPAKIDGALTANANGGSAQQTTDATLAYWYNANTTSNIYVQIKNINGAADETTYNGTKQKINNVSASPFTATTFYFDANYAGTATDGKINAGTYSVIVDVVANGNVVGRKLFNSWTIKKETLSIVPSWSTGMSNGASKVYNGAQQGLLSFTVSGFVGNESVAGGHAAFNVTPTICTIANPSSGSTYTIGNSTNVSNDYRITISLANSQNYEMDLSVAYSWKITKRTVAIIDKSYFYGANIVTDPVFETQNGDNGLVNGHIVTGWIADVTNKGFDWLYGAIDSSGSKSSVFKFSNIVINNDNVITSNYKIDTEYTLTINEGDFGVYGTTDIEKNPWGSPHNPYVIGTKEQLTRLSAIVGGTSAVNSIKNDTYVYVQAQSGDYSGAYFKLADNIPSVGNITPIGSNTHSFAGNFDGNNKTISGLNISVAGNNVGLFGYISGATIKNLTVNGSVKGSSNVGGVVGYANGTNIKNATNNASVEGDTSVGGIVGYADSTSRMYGTIVNSGNITANSMVGGVSGENHGFWCDINSLYGTFKNFGSINGRNGATVGGVTAFADKEMCNAENTGNVIGGNAVGGVAGRVQAPIKNSYNSGEIVGTNPTAQGEISGTPTGVFVGGITGYTTVNGTISNCYNKGHIAAHSASGDYINNGDYVGGIVGFAQAKVEYCANIGGLIEGNNFIGGIVGSALDNTNIDYCYDVQGQRKFRWDGCNHGSITGSGGNVTNSWAINEKQVQTTANNPNPVVSTKGYRLTTAFAVTPQVDLQNTTNQKWEDILSSKINGFKVVGSVAKNEFFCSDNGSDTNTKYVKPSKTEGFAGDNGDVTTWYSATIASNIRVRVQNITLPTIGSKEYDGLAHGFGHTTYPNTANGAAANNPIVYTTEFLYVGTTYKENLNVSPTNVDVYNTTVTIKIDGQIVGVKKGDTVTITERLLKVSNVWTSASEHVAGDTSNVYIFHYNTQHQGIIENGISVASVHGEFAIPQDVYTIGGYVETKQAHNDTTHTRTFTLNDIRNYKIENKYSQYDDFSPNTVLTEDTSDRGISEATVGDTIVVTYTWKIVPYSLATNITSGNVWFGGRTDLIVGNQGIANVEVGTISYADKRFYPLQSAQTGVQQVLVYSGHNYAHANFVLYVKYNNGTVAVLTQGTEYTLSALDAPTVENPAPLNTSVTASGKGNFDGDITKWYTALHSDFGGNVTGANWGSADNPYVISKPEHLLRLSQIVNGGTAWNSIQNTVTAGVCIAPQTTAKATSRDYKDAYFLVTADIDMSGYISTDGVYNFLPIGTRSTQNQTELPFSATFDGGDNTITYVYNVGSFYNVNGARTNYVGLFGYLNGATISNLKVASNGGLSITDNDGIVGIEYVGGIAGCAVDSTLYNTVLAYGGWVRGENYVGGIVGYGERITIESSEAVSSANVGGETYVGGIVGKWIVSNQNQIGGSFAGQAKITLPSGQQIHGVKYVGGIAGWMDTSSCATTISYAPQLNNNGEKVGVYGTEYVGALFGAFIGNGYHQNATNDKYTAIVIDKASGETYRVGNVKVLLQNPNGNSASGNAKVVGGLVGYAEGVGILFNTDWTTSNVTIDTGGYTPSFIGGIAGVLGKNATIEAIYQYKEDGTLLAGSMHKITNDTKFGEVTKLGSFVGGIVGYVSSQAGVYWETGTTIFGNGISLVNSATIYATSYAGGIFGALGDIPASVAKDFESDSILYKVLTTGVREGSASTILGLAPTIDSNYIKATGRLVNNASISVSGSYVGGIAGYGGAKVRFMLRNTPQDSAIDVSKLNIYSGCSDIFINGSYAGGIAGYLVDNLEHELQYIVVQAKFDSANAKRVGGLVGYMGSGKVERCVVTCPDGTSPDGTSPNGTISATTDNGNYQGAEYVGGLVGETQNAIITNSVSTGFNLAQTTNTKGGLLGGGTNPTIESSWTFYIAQSKVAEEPGVAENKKKYKTTYPTYSTVSENTYGKYILVDNRLYNNVTFADLCKFAGITQGATAGILEFSVDVPGANKTGSLKNKQLAFYNASGSDAVTSNKESFKGFDNSNNVLTIKLDMASGTSMQICVADIEFVNVPQHDTDNDEAAHAVVESTYKKPSNSKRYHVDVTQANFDIANTKQVTHIKANVYFECNGTLTVISDGVYLDLRKVGDYDSGTLTPGSQENPYTISNQKEWNDFAYSVYTGTDYTNKYVKLLTNDIVINTGNNGSGMHEGTKGSHSFGSVQAIPSAGQNAPLTDANGNAVDRNNIGYNFAGDISHDGNVNNFHGTFDGNGHYITVNYGSGGFYRVSVFPNAAGATFRNLTIKGYIQAASQMTGANGIANSAAYDVAGFVGKPFGTLKFYNCTNEADIIGLRNVAGLVGYNAGGHSITLEACVNTGDITSLQGTYTLAGFSDKYQYFDSLEATYGTVNIGFNSGTGGIIGAYTGNITIESCRNAGTIIGGHNVGGIIGLHEGTSSTKATLTIQNCANTGNVLANSGYWVEDEGKIGGAASEGVRQYIFGYAGGLVGLTGQYSTLKMYASYNTGDVTTYSNMVGGLVGSVGAMYQPKGEKNAVKTGGRSTIAYCYNTGNVRAGGTFPKRTQNYSGGREHYGGSVVGGLVGLVGDIQISQSYNSGDVWQFGIIAYGGSWQVRAGGIVGQSQPTSGGYVLIDNVYNIGTINIRSINTVVGWDEGVFSLQADARYGAAISGYCDISEDSNRIKVADCYSINNCVSSKIAKDISGDNEYIKFKNGTNEWYNERFDEWYKNDGVAGIGGAQVDLIETGRVYNTYDALTAAMDANSKLRMTGNNFAFDQSIQALQVNYNTVSNYTAVNEQILSKDKNNITSITEQPVGNLSSIGWKNFPDSWLYVYGCLPQLSVFALDTQNGLSMRSVGYGKDVYDEYNENGLPAGSEQYPYIIKDGVDLMGMQALVDAGYSFEGKYIEVADGKNNLDGLASKRIKLATYDSTDTAATNDASNTMYKAVDKDGNYKVGKSYHLLLQGAIFNKARNKDGSFVGSDYASWAWNTYYYNGGYRDNEWTDSGSNPNKFYNYGGMRQLGIFALQNFIPMGRGSSVFKGHFSGEQANGENTTIDDVRITTGKYGTTTEYGSEYGGLFAKVQDAYIGYISIGGSSKIWSFTKENDISACGGIVGLALGDTVIDNCGIKDTAEIGSYGVSKTNEYVILDNGKIVGNITNGNFAKDTYAGGIVGMADPKQGNTYNAGITTTIRNCSISSSGRIESAKSNIGGVLGYVGGDAGANGKGNSVRIERCEVQKAAIQAASSATESSHIGGVLGYGSEYVAAFITGCKVGNGADTVTIKGEHSLGGIAGGMSNAKGGYIDSCIVGANTTIERINQGGGNISENPKHGTAIGGLVGFTQNSNDDTSPLTTTFSGTSAFNGTITVSVAATYQSSTLDATISCIGGIVGDMGSGANFASGSNVTVGGNINITLAAANVGGVVGRTNKATFIGKFNVAPNMSTENAENVGGFIGKNIGTVYILADTTDKLENTTVGALNGTEITIGGKIKGTSEVGGFIGVNNSGSTLNIGSNIANAKAYKSGTLEITITASVTGSHDNVGGIVGKNEGVSGQDDYAIVDIVKGTITQQGTINGANNVGGIIGLNDGLLTTGGGEADTSIGGIALSDDQIGLIKNLSITNIGNVTGSGNYVGGVVGKLDSPATLRTEDLGKGAIAGTFTNSGTVVGNSFVGGSLGFVGKNVTITAKNNVATLFVNDGQVTATGYFVGGSIGALVGKIQGENSSVAVKFENKKKVNATGFVGGSIGVLAGPVKYAQFVKSSGNLSIAAVNAVGGSVGFIGVPTPLETILTGVGITLADDYVKVENTHFETSGELTANPDSNAISVAKDAATNKSTGWGGVGGAIGVIGKNVRWGTEQNKNTYYANGNVTANGINNVGGIVGIILAENVNISNMLAYNTTVKGGENVGGIVGATDGIGTVITSAYAIEGTFTGSKNVGGIIGLAKTDTDASTSYWVKGYANSDIATYDVKDLSKLGFTTGKATTGWFFLYAKDANDATGANGLGIINTSHSTNSDLQYWKRIADAYTASERQTKIKDETGVEYTLATIPLKSNIVKDKDINGADTKSPQKSTLYATATAAEVTEKGYYMYTATSNNDVKPSVIYDNGVYYISVKTNVINAEDEKVQAQNVAVFYRSVSSSKEALIYNGYLRNAIIGLDGVDLYENPIGDNETPTINGYEGQYIFTATTTIKNADGSTSEVNEAQSDPNTYSSVIKIYYVDDNGTARLVGGNTELAWKITERELAVAFEHTTNRTYGTGTEDNTTDMTVTIDNIAPKRGVTVPIRIVVSYGTQEDSRVIFTWDGTKFNGADENIKLTSLPMSQSGTLSDKDKESTSETIEDEATYQLVVKLFFKQAKSYTITVLDSSQKARYTFKKNGGSASAEVSDEFTVLPAQLTLRRGDKVAASSAYDGTAKGTAWVVEGFKYNDGIQQFSEFAPSFNIAYKNSGAITKAMTAENMTTGVDFNGPRVTVSGPTGGDLTITLSSAIKKGDYYLSFGNYKAGNYVLTADDSVRSYSIVEIQITISCADNGKSKVYNGQTQTIEISFVASVPSGSGITDFEGIENFAAFISEFFNIKEGDFTVTKPSNTGGQKKEKEVKWTITTGKNAKEYKFEFEKGNKYNEHIQNCSHKPETLPTYKYTITKRPLTLTTTLTELPTGASQYTYNTSHQGLSKIKVDDLVANDTIGVTIKIGTQSATVELENNNAKDVTDKVSTIDAGTYSVSFALSTNTSYPQNENYTLTATDVTWKIDKYKIMIGEFEIGAEKTYNAEAEVPKINVTNSEVSGNGTTFNYGTDTFTLEYSVSYNGKPYAGNKLVNAGTYKINIGTSNGKIIAKHSDGTDASDNYEFGNSATEHPYVINPCPIEIVWNIKSYVYNASNQMLSISGIKIGENDTVVAVFSADKVKGLGNDTLTFNRSGGGTDVGSYTTKVTSHSVSGEPNHGVRPIAGNYKIVSGATSDKFSITPSKLKIFYAGGTTSKVYDATTTVKDNNFTFTVSSTNFGANGTSELFDISYVYKDKNVGNDKEVVFTYVLKQNANYEYVGTGTESQNKGQITPAHIKVALNKLRSGKATRTFTNKPYYGGENGASSGEKDGKSTVYRSGEGFTVSGVLSSDAIKVVAEYREADDSRNGTGNSFDLSSYVNDVVKNKDGTFDMAEAGTHYFKTLVFTMTGTDAKNYTFNVYNKLGTDGKKYSEKDSTAGDKQTITVYDSRDTENKHQNASGAEKIQIEITVKSVRVDYGNAYQSYANADNTYNTNWNPIIATSQDITAADGTIDVVNNWMYENNDPSKPKREYHGYTTIRGSEKSTVLGATVSKDKGMNFNFRLINQPVLTIAYIVENNGVYEIDTLARLLIASFYYTAHQNPGDQIFMQIVQSGYKWFEVVNGEDYSQVDFAVPEGSPITVDDTIKTWDAYINALNEKGYVVFYNETEKAWGCYVSDSSQSTSLPSSYKLTKDISGKFTADDIKVLDAFFTVTTTDGNGQFTTTKYTWSGEGSDYLKNVLSAAVDKVATINGSLFVSQKAEGAAAITGFDGTFDGNGYVIEYLNIMGYGKDNVGLFDVIGANGIVKNLHLRNVTINGNAKYVGGIAGKVLAAADALTEKSVKNVSFHGSINVTGSTDQSVGGLFGISERAVENAIVLGSITVSNVNAKVGGVVGTATAGLNNVVSMMQITASGGTVGAFTSDNANIGEKCTHMTNAVWKRPTSDTGLTSGTGFVNVGGKNVSYNALMSGSNSLYANATFDSGTYDVISETFADSGQNVNPRQSKRLRDMVSVYLLMYSLSANGGTYTISSSSWLVGTADGTTAKPIVIANKQNVSLLRELRFAAFVLKANVSIDIASTFSGAFYGSVTSENGKDYKITCNKQMFEEYATKTQAWLEVKP